MLRKIIIGLITITLVVVGMAGCGSQQDSNPAGQAENGQGTNASINGQSVDENTAKNLLGKNTKQPAGLPQGFPSAVPFYANATIIEAHNYGSDGYTVVYAVEDPYEKVVDFYLQNIEGLDDSGIGEDESYFEGMDIGDIHINGLTITDADDQTQVFITLRDYSKESGAGDDYDDEYVGESSEPEQITYINAQEVALDTSYPADVVPIYPSAKVIECSMTPSGKGGFVNLVLPHDAYKDAVAFYEKELGLKSKTFKSETMVSETFKGETKGYTVSVAIGQYRIGNNDPLVSITVNK